METLKKQKQVLEEWDRDIWVLLVEKAVVHTNGSIHLNSSVVEQ